MKIIVTPYVRWTTETGAPASGRSLRTLVWGPPIRLAGAER